MTSGHRIAVVVTDGVQTIDGDSIAAPDGFKQHEMANRRPDWTLHLIFRADLDQLTALGVDSLPIFQCVSDF